MKPGYTLAFLVSVLGALALIGAAMPEAGVKLGALEFTFPDPRTPLYMAPEEKVDISDIIALEVDSLTRRKRHARDRYAERAGESRIAYPNDDPGMLRPALAALNKRTKGARPVRVLHYGDSQLEGDRITSYLRNKFQLKWGGGGTGLVPITRCGAVLQRGP